MITPKTPQEIEIMRTGGKIAHDILDIALKQCIPGKTTKDIDSLIELEMKKAGVEPWFREVDHYPFVSCISVNDVLVHGMPNETRLNAGDIVSVDLGIRYKKLYLDTCWTVVSSTDLPDHFSIRDAIQHQNEDISKFLQTGVSALLHAIKAFQVHARMGDVSSAMQKTVEAQGYSVSREYQGHGVGHTYHEEPAVPCYGTKGAGIELKEGVVCAIEIMYAVGNARVHTDSDGWSAVTDDHSLSAMFEHTVVTTESGPEILT